MFVPCTSCGHVVAVNAHFCPACGREYPARNLDGPASSATDPWLANFNAGLQFIASEDYQAALAALGKAIVGAPGSQLASCHATRGYTYLCMQQYERALSDCDEAIKLDPNAGEAIAWRGSVLAGLARWREAIDDLKLAIELRPENAMEYEQAGFSISEQAILDFRERVKNGDASDQLFYDRGVIYAFRGEAEKAVRDFTQAIEANASHAPSYFARAQQHYEAGRNREAMEDCTAAIQLGFTEPEAIRLRSVLAEETGDLERALADLNRLLKRQSNDITLLRQRAQLYSRQLNFSLAHRDYSLLLQLNDSLPDVFVSRGIVRFELGDYWGAVDDFSRSLDQVPGDAETLALRGEARLAANQTKQALEDFDAAIEQNSACTSAHRGRALVYSACGRHDQAMRVLEKALRLDPRYGLGLAAKGRIFQELQQFDNAIQAYNAALEIIGDGRGAGDARFRRGVCLAARQRWKEAARDLDAAIRRRPSHAGAYVWRANVRFRTGDWISALTDLNEASKLNANDAPHYRRLAEPACQNFIERLTQALSTEETAGRVRERGVARQFIGQPELALADFNAAVERDSNDKIARMHRAVVLCQAGQTKRAVADYNALIEIEPGEARHWLGRAACYLECGNVEQALADVNRAIGLAPQRANNFLQRAGILLRQGKPDSALTDLDRAICLAPQRPEGYYDRAKIRAAKKRYSAALKDLNRAIERAPHLHQAVLLRAELFSRAGDNERALTDFENAIALAAASVQAHCGRALTLARLGKHDDALRELTKVLRLFDGAELATLLSCRAKIAYNAGRFRLAVADFDMSLRTDALEKQQQANSLYGRGLAMYQLDDLDGSKKSFRKAIALAPSLEPAILILDWMVGKTGRRPAQLDPPQSSVKLAAPPLMRPRLPNVQSDARWDAEPPWNLWLISSADDDAEFGPVERSILDRWCQQGRIGEQTLLLRADWDEWKWASDVYPQLGHANRISPQKEGATSSVESKDQDSREPFSFPEIQV